MLPSTARGSLRTLSICGTLLPAVAGLVACERQAPGPTECLSFALNWHQVSAAQLQAQVLPPQLEASVQQVTLRCLTEPFPRKTVECVAQYGPAPACLPSGGVGNLR